MKVNLSIIILSYNTKELTKKCLQTLFNNIRSYRNFKSEITVLDNYSSDGSVEMLKNLAKNNQELKLILSRKNLGFAKGNNQALKAAGGKYILFLNSDVILQEINFADLINYLEGKVDVGALTVQVLLYNGLIDPASHRGFPTLLNSFFYFSGMEKLTNNIPIVNKLFGGYHLTQYSLNYIHEIDAPSGAFFLARKEILNQLGGFDESFFFYGEDIDLAFRIKKLGYKIIYYPKFKVLHLKRISGLKTKDQNIRNKTKYHFYNAMKIFYRKHYEKIYPSIINKAFYFLVDNISSKYAKNWN